jgi:hypothetical protein
MKKETEYLSEQELLVKILEALQDIKKQMDKLDPDKAPALDIIDNADFMKKMNITDRTASEWRSKGVLPYSKVEGRIYYRISDIEKLLQKTLKKDNK